MKKILSLVLVLSLVLGSFGMAFADTSSAAKTTPKDVYGTPYEDAVTALTALGVVDGYEDGSYRPANIVTRAEMAKLIVAELGLTANATGAKSTFKDMAGYDWADGYVGYAQSLGIIAGYPDGTFRPGNTVSYDEALTMIVSALGYTKQCKEMNGTWPAIYVQKARVLGITDDVKAGGSTGANRGDIAIYLYNMLTSDMGYADADGVYVTKKDKDGLAVKVITCLDAEESYNYAVITKSDADNAVVNIRNYVGAYAKVFTLTKGKNDGDVIAISDIKSDFISGEYKHGDKVIKAADGTEYKLDDIYAKGICGTSKELNSNSTAVEFVNGDIATAGSTILNADQQTLDTNKDKTVVTIAADLSGKTVKGIYSVLFWNITADEKVDADDLKDITNNQTLLGREFALDDNDEIDYDSFELVGVNSLSDIKVDNVVYVYENNDDEIARVAVGTEVVKGKITAIKEGKTTKVTIDGKNYNFASEKLEKNGVDSSFDKTDIDTGDEVEIFLDAYGYMYDYNSISSKADNYAVVLETGMAGDRIGEKNQIKLFLPDGTDKVFDVDNDLFKAGDVVADVTSDTADANGSKWLVKSGDIVKYGVDKDGIIDTFEALKTGDYKIGDKSGAEIDITKKGYYDGLQIKDNAVIFSFDGTKAEVTNGDVDPTDEDNYDVTTLDKVLDTADVAAVYVTDKNKIVAMLMYDYSGTDDMYGVIYEARKTSGDSDYEAVVFVDGVKKTYGLSTEKVYNDAVKGSKSATDTHLKLFRLDFNASGEIKGLIEAWTDSITKTFDKKDILVADANKASYTNNIFTYDGDDVKVMKDAVVYKDDDNDFKVGSLSDLRNLKDGQKVYFYDTEDDNNDGLMNLIVIK